MPVGLASWLRPDPTRSQNLFIRPAGPHPVQIASYCFQRFWQETQFSVKSITQNLLGGMGATKTFALNTFRHRLAFRFQSGPAKHLSHPNLLYPIQSNPNLL